MRIVSFPVFLVVVVLGVLVWPANEALAGVHLDYLVSQGEISWHAGSPGAKHPNQCASSLMIVDQNFINSLDQYAYCFSYYRSARTKPKKGKVTVTVKVIGADGESKKIAKLSGRVSNRVVYRCGPVLLYPLEVGDLVVWQFKFQNMPGLKDDYGWSYVMFRGWIASPTAPYLASSEGR